MQGQGERNATARRHLAAIFRQATAAVHGTRAVAAALKDAPVQGTVTAVAIGKVADAMLLGAFQALGNQLMDALLIGKAGRSGSPLCERENVHCLAGGHPVPDSRSLTAGRQLLEWIAGVQPGQEILFLISGGCSSLVEVLPEGLRLQDLQQVNQWLLSSGLDIVSMNRVRSRLSLIKSGGLLQFLGGHPARALLVSDVPGDDPAVIGSGLLFPSPGDMQPVLRLPDWLTALPLVIPAARSTASGVSHTIVASLDMALEAAQDHAQQAGYSATIMQPRLDGDAATRGGELADFLCSASPGVYLWGGETTVFLPSQPGTGGRNQHLALSAALRLAGRTDILLLSAGTDGEDGNTRAAGAIVDGGTIARALARGYDPGQCLLHADAGTCLAASHDLFYSGDTGTNVADMVIGMKLAGDYLHAHAH